MEWLVEEVLEVELTIKIVTAYTEESKHRIFKNIPHLLPLEMMQCNMNLLTILDTYQECFTIIGKYYLLIIFRNFNLCFIGIILSKVYLIDLLFIIHLDIIVGVIQVFTKTLRHALLQVCLCSELVKN